MTKPYRLSFRVDESTYNWLEDLGQGTHLSVSEIAREVIMTSKMTKDTKVVYGKLLEYLGSLDSPGFFEGLVGLIETIKEVKGNA